MSGKIKKSKMSSENRKKSRDLPKNPKSRNPNSVLRRNARERDRIRNVNDAFDSLRNHVPNGEAIKGRKISKVETLKSAIEYIHALKDILGDEFQPIKFEDEDDASCTSGDNLIPKSPEVTDQCGSEIQPIKNTEPEPGSPESGIHSNETSVDYSMNPVGPIESLLFNTSTSGPTSPGTTGTSGSIMDSCDNAMPDCLSNVAVYPSNVDHSSQFHNFENYDFSSSACSNLLQQLQQQHQSDSTASSYTSFPFEF